MKLPKPLKKVIKTFEKQPDMMKLIIMLFILYCLYYLYKQLRWGIGSSMYLEGFMDKTFVFFKMEGCPHCVKMQPEWDKFKKNNKSGIATAEFEASKNPEECKKYGVKGFPTLLLIQNGKVLKTYSGDRKASAFEQFVNSNK